MKKILIATTNKDKFKIINFLLKRDGLTEDEYKIEALENINYNGPDSNEVGNIKERAKRKAETVKDHLNNNTYDFIIGIDDGIIIKGKMLEDVKEYLKKILYEHYLSNDEKIIFPRAYFMINSN